MAAADPKGDRLPSGDRDEFLRELEVGWERWARGYSPADATTNCLLRAAFAAGYEAAPHDTRREF